MKEKPDIGEISFPEVVEKPVMWGYHRDLHQADKYKAIVNPDTGKLFSVVSNDYRLIRHEEAIEQIEKAIYEVPELGRYETFTEFYNDITYNNYFQSIFSYAYSIAESIKLVDAIEKYDLIVCLRCDLLLKSCKL